MQATSTAEAVDTVVALRRRLLAGTVALPLAALVAALGLPVRARAATDMTPSALRDLDAAAMALFDAAETSRWLVAQQALERARTAADAVGGLESAYLTAGGRLTHFFQARNNLSGDLIEAKTALSMKDRRWLVNGADRIAARAGELSQPFAEHTNAIIPRIEALLFLTRRMRRALVWQDNIGYRAAQDDFKRLWRAMGDEVDKQPPDKVRALGDAFARVTLSRSSTDLRSLYTAIRGLREFVR